jgi:hypothetical protein
VNWVMDRCRLCEMRRERNSDYCAFHLEAIKNLEEAYEVWRKALQIEWTEFLELASERPETGQWAREAAIYLSMGGREA